ncbi:MAG: hypothetical protein NZ772_19185, partial [Cyanobacteria bacterium]|nr:hypothetical protein [Cyanobacteriota bacterium]
MSSTGVDGNVERSEVAAKGSLKGFAEVLPVPSGAETIGNGSAIGSGLGAGDGSTAIGVGWGGGVGAPKSGLGGAP